MYLKQYIPALARGKMIWWYHFDIDCALQNTLIDFSHK